MGFGVSGAHATPLVRRTGTATLIRAAVEAGVKVFDTAPAYGAGEAERRLGLALRGLARESVFVSTKAGVSSAGLARRLRDFSPDAIERSVRASVHRLGLEGVDALILHGPDPSELTPALFKRLEELKRAGAFRWLGVAGRGEELDAALLTGHFQILMAPVHPFIGEPARARLLAARAGGVRVVGIEAAGTGAVPLRLPRKPADLYPLVRALRAPARASERAPMPGALVDPLRDGLADCVMMTTTRAAHLAANAAVMKAFAGRT